MEPLFSEKGVSEKIGRLGMDLCKCQNPKCLSPLPHPPISVSSASYPETSPFVLRRAECGKRLKMNVFFFPKPHLTLLGFIPLRVHNVLGRDSYMTWQLCKLRIRKPKWLTLGYMNHGREIQNLQSSQGQRRKRMVCGMRKRICFLNISPGIHIPQRIRTKQEDLCVFKVHEWNGVCPQVCT